MNRFVCIHAHFYQPPRENPWLEAIEVQESAYPYHDWNERITAECYAPNAAARILDGDGRITSIVNTYSAISFNFGPTLLSYLAEERPEIIEALRAADARSQERFSGHGSALAQAYNHMILPLANPRDKFTQVLWGIRDFERYFGRKPEGMWLAETAVDVETLEVMAELGVRFTILAPHQAHRVRAIGGGDWQDVTGARIDPSRAYRQCLPSGRSIDLFFYDGPISQAVAFEKLLTRGEQLANRLAGVFSNERSSPQLVHIATDGETYGHHHRYGEMALAYALEYLEKNDLAELTVYGEHLENFPPEYEVEIYENTSWSCAHGVERWRSNCGCNSGGRPGWNQAWRAPLREALDWLRDAMAPEFERLAGEYLKDPWMARNAYIDVIHDRRPEVVDAFLDREARRPLGREERTQVLQLLELQRHAMLMYTSCGWFFDDLAGLETVQVIEYAGRVLQLAEFLFDTPVADEFLQRLARARSNVFEKGSGQDIYEAYVLPARVDFHKVTAHFAINSLFQSYPDEGRIYCYDMRVEEYKTAEAGKATLVVGRVCVTSLITRRSGTMSFGVLHLGDHNVNAGVRRFRNEADFDAVFARGKEALDRGDFPELIRHLDKEFGSSTYSLKSLFRDEQKRVLDSILGSTLAEVEAEYQHIYESRLPLIRFLSDLGNPLPRGLKIAAEYVNNSKLRAAIEQDPPEEETIKALLEEARRENLRLDAPGIEFAFRTTLERIVDEVGANPSDLEAISKLRNAVSLRDLFPFDVDLWQVQNVFYQQVRSQLTAFRRRAAAGDSSSNEWVQAVEALGEKLTVSV